MREPETLKELIHYIEDNMRKAYESHMGAKIVITDGDGLHELLRNLKEDSAYIDRAKSCE